MKVVILTGSARVNSVSEKVLPLVSDSLAHKNVEVEEVHVSDLNLPFYNAPMPPSAPDFEATDENVIAWTNKVAEADAVVLLTPEYNGGPSAIQKNAIDWVYKEWADKPVVMVGYGWYSPSRVHQSLAIALETIKAKQGEHVQLQFGSDIEMDGSLKNEASVQEKIETAVSSII